MPLKLWEDSALGSSRVQTSGITSYPNKGLGSIRKQGSRLVMGGSLAWILGKAWSPWAQNLSRVPVPGFCGHPTWTVGSRGVDIRPWNSCTNL